MNTHTPGPWKSDGYHVRQSGQSGTRMIADVCYTGPHHTPPDEYPVSCRIADEANACLIASSPELLESISNLLAAMPDLSEFENSDGEPMKPRVDACLAAIAKATGKEPS